MPRLRLLLSLALLVSAGSVRAATLVQVAGDMSDGGARLILTHSERIGYVVEPKRGKLRVVYTNAIRVDPEQGRFESRIVRGYRARDEATLELDLGRGYGGYETFELQNPFRVVLDLKPAAVARRSSESRGSSIEGTIIVIDPGHGGIEHGAVGPSGLQEKEVTLDVARRLESALRSLDGSVSVVLTRDEDRLLGLDERTATANHNRADLFVSIHANAAPGARAKGAETYYLSTDATDQDARRLAQLENRSPSGGDGLDLVLWDLAQQQSMAESAALAESIQKQMNRLAGTRNRGVRQAPFRVLMGAQMPAVLVEIGFISNPDEERSLAQSGYRDRIVDALVEAIREFLTNLKRLNAP